MKFLLTLLALVTLSSCSDQMRTRLGNCRSGNVCGKSALSVDANFRKTYIAIVNVPVTVSNSKIVLKETVYDSEADEEYNCQLDVAKNTQFTFTIRDNTLELKNGITKIVFKKTNGLMSDDLKGTWAMTENVGKKAVEKTELEYNYDDEIRLTKTCKLR